MDGMLEPEEWDAMNWKARTDFIKKKFGYSTFKEMSEKMFSGCISEASILQWRANVKTVPGKRAAEFMRKKCVRVNDAEEQSSASTALVLDASMDAASTFLSDILTRRDSRQLSAAAHCLAAKVAFMVSSVFKGRHVCTFSSAYGRYPVAETIHITDVKYPDLETIIIVTHQENATDSFILDATYMVKGKKHSHIIVEANDYGLSYLLSQLKSLTLLSAHL